MLNWVLVVVNLISVLVRQESGLVLTLSKPIKQGSLRFLPISMVRLCFL